MTAFSRTAVRDGDGNVVYRPASDGIVPMHQYTVLQTRDLKDDGLLHASQMRRPGAAWSDPLEAAFVGQRLRVVVLSVDVPRRRLSLGLAPEHEQPARQPGGAAAAGLGYADGGQPGGLPGGHGQSGQRKRRVDGEAHQAQAQQQQRMQQQQRKKGRTT